MKLVTLLIAAVLWLMACSRQNNAHRGIINKDKDEMQYMGAVLPSIIGNKNDTIGLGFNFMAAYYYLDLRLKGSDKYYSLLKVASRNNEPVRVWVFKEYRQGIEVAKIEQATRNEIDSVKQKWQQVK